jgi:phosphoglycerol transferase MdoB-like AlkP superfamily enzyme
MLAFDLMWMAQTTFRPFCFLPFWPYLLLAATLLSLPALLSRHIAPQALTLLAADGVMMANLMYCNTYFNAIPARSYLLAGNLADFTASVADSLRWHYFLLPVITAAAALTARRLRLSLEPRPARKPYAATLALLALLAWASDAWRGGAMKNIDALENNCYKATCIAPVYTIAGYVTHDLLRSSQPMTEADVAAARAWLRSQRRYLTHADSAAARPTRDNLVMIFCESLESWPIGLTVDGTELTPTLNALVAEATTLYAPNVVTQVANGRSIDGQLLMLAGMLPMKNRVYAYDCEDNLFMTIPKAMKAAGARRAYLLTCDRPHVWNQTMVARAFGIDSLLTDSSWDNNEPVGTNRRLSDGGLMRQSVDKLRRSQLWPVGEKAFAMWVTYSGHNPFRLPDHLRAVDFGDGYPRIVADYMTTVNYTDRSLATLIGYLKSRPDWPRTMVVITGDHEGLAADRREAMKNSRSAAFVDPVQHTPLIVLNSPVAGRFDTTMGQVDVYSTILDLMGLDTYAWRGMGQSLLDPAHPGVAIGTAGDIQGDASAIGPERLGHLKQSRDISDKILSFNLLERLAEAPGE